MEEDRKEREKEEKQMTLEDFEKLREEKKKAIEDMMGSKKTVAPAKSDFSGMAAVAKADLEEEITGIELTTGRKEKALKEKAQKEKTKQMLAASFRVASETDYAPARRDRDRAGEAMSQRRRGDVDRQRHADSPHLCDRESIHERLRRGDDSRQRGGGRDPRAAR